MDNLIFLSQVDKTRCLSWLLKTAPCQAKCPIDLDVESFVSAAARGDYMYGLNIIRRKTPFAGVLGRVCTHPCETVCRRSKVDEPISIKAIKRFLADHGRQHNEEIARVSIPAAKGKVAVVGSGPAGLSCAYDLARTGYAVTIYEGEAQPGGWMRYGIPQYRLPAEILDYEIGLIRELGVEIRLGTRIGKDLKLKDLRERFSAVFLATGAWDSRKVNIEGIELNGVLWGTEFLKNANSGEKPRLTGKVVVIGGGNVAINAALTALRTGAGEVLIVYRRDKADMPAAKEEVDKALEEGVTIDFHWVPRRFFGNNSKVTGIELVRFGSNFKDERHPSLESHSKETKNIDADVAILAVGQATDTSYIDSSDGINVEGGIIQCDPLTLETSVPGIFAGGDSIQGPRTVVAALASGKRAAISIARYLERVDLRDYGNVGKPAMPDLPVADVTTIPRAIMPQLDMVERQGNFREIELGLDEKAVIHEAGRCLRCYTCHRCSDKWSCSAFLYVENGPKNSPSIDASLCEACGVCARNCPYHSVIMGTSGDED